MNFCGDSAETMKEPAFGRGLLLPSAVNTKTQVAIAKPKAAASVIIAQTLMYLAISPSASPLSTISAVSSNCISL